MMSRLFKARGASASASPVMMEAVECRRLFTAWTVNFGGAAETVEAINGTVFGSPAVGLSNGTNLYYGTVSGTTITVTGSGAVAPPGTIFAAIPYSTLGSDPLIVNLAGGNDSFSVDSGVSATQEFYVDGGTGQDNITGGQAGDTIFGGDNVDTLNGAAGSDYVNGGDSADSILGGTQADTLHGGSGNDTISGQGGNDRLYGEGGSDSLSGDADNDILDGGLQNDTLLGGSGNDTYYTNNDSLAVDTVGFGTGDAWGGQDGNEILI